MDSTVRGRAVHGRRQFLRTSLAAAVVPAAARAAARVGRSTVALEVDPATPFTADEPVVWALG